MRASSQILAKQFVDRMRGSSATVQSFLIDPGILEEGIKILLEYVRRETITEIAEFVISGSLYGNRDVADDILALVKEEENGKAL